MVALHLIELAAATLVIGHYLHESWTTGRAPRPLRLLRCVWHWYHAALRHKLTPEEEAEMQAFSF